MKFSIHQVALNARGAFIRFPWVALSAFAGTFTAIYLIEVNEVTADIFPLINIVLCAALGIPLFLVIQLFVEKTKMKGKYQILLRLAAALLLVLIYFSFPNQDVTQNTFQPYIRYGIYNACIHLLVSFLPFVWDRNGHRFWNYNIFLFTRLLISLLYSLVLFVGVVLALVALHLLFDIDFDDTLYLQLFVLIMGLFNTLFFLSGIPKRIGQMDGSYLSKGIRIFAQYILLPLLAGYLLILYGYGIKILSSSDWPRGIISYLILCVAVLGIFNFLLLYPYGQVRGADWIRKITRGFYGLLIPLVILLFVAITMRVEDYGFTVNRYLIVILGIWLFCMSVYFLLGKKNIAVIPMSLAVLFFFVSFGPWGMFSVSERSQVHRLEAILSQSHRLEGGKIQGEVIWDTEALPELIPRKGYDNGALLSDSLHNEVSSIIHYLENYHGFGLIKPWFSQDLHQLLMAVNKDKLRWQRTQEAQIYMETMGLEYFMGSSVESVGSFSFETDHGQTATPLTGYDYLIDFNINESEKREFMVEGHGYTLQLNKVKDGLELLSEKDSLSIPLTALFEGLLEEPQRPMNKDLSLISQSQLLYEEREKGLKLEIHYLNFRTDGNGNPQVQFMSGFLLLNSR